MTAKVGGNENLLDICLSYTGSVESLFDIAEANGIMPDEDLYLGQILTIPAVIDQDMVSYLADKNHKVATEPSVVQLSGGVAFSEGFNNGYE